jgi:hypothetical protein
MDELQHSIFGDSLALAAFDQMTEGRTEDGESYTMQRLCEVCGLERRVEIEWAELYCVALGKDPHTVSPQLFEIPWRYDRKNGKMYPDVRCNCKDGQQLVYFPMTPQKAKKLVSDAIESGTLNGRQKALIDQLRQHLLARAPVG